MDKYFFDLTKKQKAQVSWVAVYLKAGDIAALCCLRTTLFMCMKILQIF